MIWRDAFRWKDDAGVLSNHYEQASVASLVAEFGYTVILDAGCAAIIRDPRATQCPAPAPCGESVAELNRALGKAFPDDQVSAIKAQGAVLPLVNRLAERLALMDKHAAIDNEVIQMLIAGGYITNDVADQAFKIAHGFEDGPLKSASSHSWWKDVKPETDLAEANDVIDSMLEDWQKVGEALGFKDFADPESIIGVCTGLFEGAPMAAAEAIVLLNGVIAKLERDDEYGLEPDLREALRLLTYGATHAKGEPSRSDEFADIREFRRREAEMDRRDAEQLAERHDEILRSQFPREASARDKAHDAVTDFVLDALNISEGGANEPPTPNISGALQPFPFDGVPRDGSTPVYGGDPEFDALPIGAGNFPEAPVPIAAEPTWKRDEEKTMLRILLLSADTTGFHGNDPAVHLARIAKWTDDECRAVDDWCVAMHLHAGDRGVRVPPKPSVLATRQPPEADPDALNLISSARGPISAEELERAVVSIIVAETRYPEHHFSHAAKRIAELLTSGAAK